MIKKLILKNFKTHEVSELEFSSGINIITGESGHGKTNILRALNWIINNRPLGTSVIQRGEENCSATLTIDRNDDKYTIERVRGKSENSYKILDGEGKEVAKFTSFGNSPPDDVSKLIGLSDINIQPQLKPYFLVLDSPGQVATYIRSLVKLDEIDQVVKLLSNKARSEKTNLSQLEDDLSEVKDRIEEINKIDIERLEKCIFEAKSITGGIQRLKEKQTRLKEVFNELQRLEKEQIYLPDDIDQKLSRLDESCNNYNIVSEKISRLNELYKQLTIIENQKISLPEDLSFLSAIESVGDKYNDTYDKVNLLLDIQEQLQSIETSITKINVQVTKLEEEKRLLISQLDICPTCGSQLTEKTRKYLLEEE